MRTILAVALVVAATTIVLGFLFWAWLQDDRPPSSANQTDKR